MTIKPILPHWLLVLLCLALVGFLLTVSALIYRTILVLDSVRAKSHSTSTKDGSNHLLIVLGSGGHTAEMISILHTLGLEYITSRFCGANGKRTWVISEGDGFSADRAREFEKEVQAHQHSEGNGDQHDVAYDIVVVPRARRVHQSLQSTPISALFCLWSCVQVLRGHHRDQLSSGSPRGKSGARYPDLMLTNGPGTAVIVVLASLLLKISGLAPLHGAATSGKRKSGNGGLMRTIYIESWARVKTLSLSGKMLRFMVGRFLVQWKGMETVDLKGSASTTTSERGGTVGTILKTRIEYVGTVVI